MSLTEDLSWLKTHLVLLTLVTGLTFGGLYGIETLIAKHDSQTASIYQQQNIQFQQQVQQEIAELKQQNLVLEQQLQARAKEEQSIPSKNGSLNATQVAQAITSTSSSKPEEVTVQGTQVCLDIDVARTALTDMQLVSLLQQDKIDLQTQLSNETKLYNDEVMSHKKDNETNALTIKALKAESRKGKLKWFGIGYVSGFISGLVVHVAGV